MIPTVFWVEVVEVGVLGGRDEEFSLTFGQVSTVPILVFSSLEVTLTYPSRQILAAFSTVPPIVEVARLTPHLWHWLINLTWVRYITGRRVPKVPGLEEMGSPIAEFTDRKFREKEGSVDSQSTFVVELPLLGKTEKLGHSDETTEHGQSRFSHSSSSVFFHASAIPYLAP